jgi:hypothetical protein
MVKNYAKWLVSKKNIQMTQVHQLLALNHQLDLN